MARVTLSTVPIRVSDLPFVGTPTTGRRPVVRSDGTIAWTDPPSVRAAAWGAGPSASSSANRLAIQNAINAAAANASQGGGVVDLPSGVLPLDQALLMYFGVRLRGRTVKATVLKADATGSFTNGSRSAFPAMIKWDGGDIWCHGVEVSNLQFDFSGVVGLSATWFQACGESSWFDRLEAHSTIGTLRTVTDAQIVSGNKTVTFTTSTVTQDDINGLVTDRTDGDYTLAGPTIPAFTKIDRINWAALGIPPDTTATSVTLSKPPTGSQANASLKIRRPTDVFVFDGGHARGYIGSLNGTDNEGALLRMKNVGQGTMHIESLSGDQNLGGLLHIDTGSSSLDPVQVTVGQIKAEVNTYGANFWECSMDPVVLLDRCGPMALTIYNASFALGATRDLVRIDNPLTNDSGGGPSISLKGIEGQNWFNAAVANIIHDSSTGEVVASSGYSAEHSYPEVFWGRNVLLGGGAKAPRLEKWSSGGTYFTQPWWSNGSPLFSNGQGGVIVLFGGILWYNNNNAQGDSMAWLDDVSPGTYDLGLALVAEAHCPIVTADLGVHVYLPPAAPTLASVAGSGSVPAGANYAVVVTYVTANGETAQSPTSFISMDGTHAMKISSPPAPNYIPNGQANPVIGWYAYVAGATLGIGSAHRQQTAGQPTPIGTDLTLTAAPTTTGASPPTTDTSGLWTPIGTYDAYAAAGAANLAQFSGITVPEHTGPVVLRYSALSRNASATGWYIEVSGRHWQRTA